jgi:hypothetical protein
MMNLRFYKKLHNTTPQYATKKRCNQEVMLNATGMRTTRRRGGPDLTLVGPPIGAPLSAVRPPQVRRV